MTNRILQCLDEGRMPWRSDASSPPILPKNGISGRQYHGVNIPLLLAQSFDDERWTTILMANKEGWRVRRGEKGTPLYAHRMRDVQTGEDPATGEPVLSKRPVLCRHVLFNFSQIEGAPAKVRSESPGGDISADTAARIDALLESMGVTIECRKGVPRFAIEEDTIHMPAPESYPSLGAYYNRLLHETAHWTGHPDRMNRAVGRDHASPDYVKEELVADLTTTMLCAKLGVPCALEDHPSFAEGYRELLSGSKRALWMATREAERVANQILGHDVSCREEIREEAAAMAADASAGEFGETFDASEFEFNEELMIDAHAATAGYQP
ncbi:MAG: zincin-like metallopeptidase domain-containing protein [Rhodanobacter sp.]